MAEYIAKVNDTKKDAVADLKSRFDGISSFIFADYRGLTVAQITEIRDKLRASDTEFKVVKNRFAKIAMKDLGVVDVDDFLKGPTAVAAVPGESNEVAKALFEFAKGMPLQVKGAVINGELFDAAKIEAFSKLPGRTQLIAMLMGLMKAPVQKLAATLQAIVDKDGEAAKPEEAKAE
ncbi:MAG: 50S ribosomal protein L10 [Spirochaetia bacterium]|nr:50S ribosomal protein L10 [Spirochaetia bacterium]MBQ3713087.1 50S ribosomal protein L10 [Spirochaetia bacterium]MBQ6904534.1 50S ribosomal protein L10 [Spirochaetia bacterium]MBR0319203.1 50S ribosomal protein L10 [Spirochaetia bacterium]